MKKGITPIIAIILLLLITISMVGFAFVWFQRIQGDIQTNTETGVNAQLNAQAQQITIENAAAYSLTVRASGTQAVATSTIGLYINDSAVNCLNNRWDSGGASTTSIAAGATGNCTLSSPCSAIGGVKTSRIRATSPGKTDATSC